MAKRSHRRKSIAQKVSSKDISESLDIKCVCGRVVRTGAYSTKGGDFIIIATQLGFVGKHKKSSVL